MSLKGVEMQVAIPRTNEATSIQNHMNQKPAHDQAMLANQTVEHSEKNRKKSSEVDASASLHVKDDGGGSRGRNGSSGREARQETAPPGKESAHPYKGKHIDISL